jgi:hypothetical protein
LHAWLLEGIGDRVVEAERGTLARGGIPSGRADASAGGRTIVRDVDQALPLILSSTALLLVLTGLGVTLVRARIVPRPGSST